MALDNFIISSAPDQKHQADGYQESWIQFLKESDSDQKIKFFSGLSGLSLSFEEYSNLIVVGAKKLFLKFGIETVTDNGETAQRFMCMLYALDRKNRIVSDYVMVRKPIEGTVAPGEISGQLKRMWHRNWTHVQNEKDYSLDYFEVPGLIADYANVEDRLIRGYTFEIQEMADVIMPVMANDNVHEVQILIGLHGGAPVKSATPSSTCTFGVVFHATGETGSGFGDGGGGNFDIGTPCPDVCPS